jgi:alpha-beta hydrolase superfamily lysophospholipase
VRLLAKTYWAGAPMNFRRPPRDAEVEPLLLRADDQRELTGLYWTPRRRPRPTVAVVCMHPRVDFGRHYTFPRLLDAGIACLGANTRNPNNDTNTIHEEIILDVNACVKHLKRDRGVEKVILLGNSGGGALNAFFQAQARLAAPDRIATTPGGARTFLPKSEMIPADGLIHLSAHRGEGRIMDAYIDPAVVDENDPLASDPELDMYAAHNGFRPAPEWSEYSDAFVRRYRDAQRARARRLDAIARASIGDNRRAAELRADPDFGELPGEEQQRILRREAVEPVMVIYRTMANLHYVDRHLDPSNREYGSLLSDRPDLMNLRHFGFGRTCTPHAWLSTWSGLSSNADLIGNLAAIAEPTLVVHAGRDREIYPKSDAQPIFEAVVSDDRSFHTIEDARHYFEPDFGSDDESARERLMDLLVPWIQQRFEGQA